MVKNQNQEIDLIRGTSQSDILNTLEESKCKWYTSKEICDLLGGKINGSISKKLRKLYEFDLLDRKRNREVRWGNEFKYKIKKK